MYSEKRELKSISHFVAFDIGATSGRCILGVYKRGELQIRELSRFENGMLQIHGHLYWNIFDLYTSIKEGITLASTETDGQIDGIGIDTWGVDFVYLASDGSIINLPRAYRDSYTDGIREQHSQLIPQREVYELTGIEFMNFNSLYQLFAAKTQNLSAFNMADKILFMPDALSYLLTGQKVCEYTIASTSQLINPHLKQFDNKLLATLGLVTDIFPPLIMPGRVIGNLSAEITKECNIDEEVPVVAVAGHDTASAIAAIPADTSMFAYLSSGTWSLMGIEVSEPIIDQTSFELNFTNEGGVEGLTCFQKNITGMWLLEQCRKEWTRKGRSYTYSELIALATSVEEFRSLIDSDHPSFSNPANMLEAIQLFCKETNQAIPHTDAQIVRCIFESLALKYRSVLESLSEVAPFPIKKLYIIGGGARNSMVNQFTANSIGISVFAASSESTAIGNIMIQLKATGYINNLQEIRQVVSNSFEQEEYCPADTSKWDEAYQCYKRILTK